MRSREPELSCCWGGAHCSLLTAHVKEGEVPDKNREVGLLFAFIILICTESPLIMQFLHFPHFPCVGSQLAIVKRMTDGAAQQESGRVISPATPSSTNLQEVSQCPYPC